MSQTRPETSEELLEAIQNTDPTSDPADDVTTGVEGTERTAGTLAPQEAADAELERIRAERDALLDRLARLQAEFENARRRADRERSEFREYATGSAAEQFLPVLDNFQLALKANGTLEQLRGGVELIAKQMEEAFRTLNVVPVETMGTAFDPRFHELSAASKPPICLTGRSSRRSAAATASGSACCGRLWSALSPIRSRSKRSPGSRGLMRLSCQGKLRNPQ